MIDLKSCPKCGSGAFMGGDGYGDWLVSCNSSLCELHCLEVGMDYKTQEQAATAWNTRPSPWIPVSDTSQLEVGKDFYVMAPNGEPDMLTFGGDQSWEDEGEIWYSGVDIAYYMPIPALPEVV